MSVQSIGRAHKIAVTPNKRTLANSSKTRRSRPRRRGNRRAGAQRGARGPLNPGGQNAVITRPRPVVEGTTSAWVKSLFDPAHARDYGCVGIPDENQNPSNVFCKRKDVNLPSSASGLQALAPLCHALYAGKNATDNELIRISLSPEFKVNSAATSKLYVLTNPVHETAVIYTGTYGITYKPVGGNATTITASVLLFTFMTNQNVTEYANVRAISASSTISNITQWNAIGGYFIGGIFPLNLERDAETFSDAKPNYSEVNWDLNFESYATYTGEAARGAYAISRPRTIDGLCRFCETDLAYLTIKVGTAEYYLKDTQFACFDLPYPTWDTSFCVYSPVDSSNWTLRLTMYQNFEVLRSYDEGGQDGATYDRAALNAAMAMMDSQTFVFPADHNDLGTVLPLILAGLKGGLKGVANAMGFVDMSPAAIMRYIRALFRGSRGRKSLRDITLAPASGAGLPFGVNQSMPRSNIALVE